MSYFDFVLRVLFSLFLGFIIGLERQLTNHPSGIRINVLICLGTSLFTLFPLLFNSDQVFWVGASIISGVGFLCSGVIFKDSVSIRGINTAATLWCSAAIGLLASTGKFLIAFTATVILVGSNIILRPLVTKLPTFRTPTRRQYQIKINCLESLESKIRLILIKNEHKNLYLIKLESGDIIGNKIEISATYTASGRVKTTVFENIVMEILKFNEVFSAGFEVLEEEND